MRELGLRMESAYYLEVFQSVVGLRVRNERLGNPLDLVKPPKLLRSRHFETGSSHFVIIIAITQLPGCGDRVAWLLSGTH
jgi:hypothetical protein